MQLTRTLNYEKNSPQQQCIDDGMITYKDKFQSYVLQSSHVLTSSKSRRVTCAVQTFGRSIPVW